MALCELSLLKQEPQYSTLKFVSCVQTKHRKNTRSSSTPHCPSPTRVHYIPRNIKPTSMPKTILFSEALLAHHALHAGVHCLAKQFCLISLGEEKVTLPGGEVCYIIKSKNGCRYVFVSTVFDEEQIGSSERNQSDGTGIHFYVKSIIIVESQQGICLCCNVSCWAESDLGHCRT